MEDSISPMTAHGDPDLFIAALAVAGLAVAAFIRLIFWVRDAPVTPDPWDEETQKKLSEPDAVEVCPHCLTEQSPTAWFCPRCGRAVGPYNNLMPYVMVFSQGEVLRNGTSGRLPRSPLIVIGYLLISVTMFPLFVPFYLFSLFLNWNRPASEPEPADHQNVQQ
ncbi:MAG TPA: hypothetical protein VMB22_09065 [Verrucomicrobiae bacterium]|nr:hypothetical protein [Verrucomicrobiae bacterium]